MYDLDRKFPIAAMLAAAWAVLVLTAGPQQAEANEVRGSVSSSGPVLLAQAGYDPGLAYLSGPQMSQYSRVGRISVQLVQKGSSTDVPFDRPFRTGDEFRFQITTNKDGWLYVLHRSPGGQFQVLYPQATPGAGQAAGTSRVVKNQHYLVPQPGEGTFVFDADTGTETFYLVIKDRQEPPSLNDVIVSGGQPPYQAQGAAGASYQQQYPPTTAPATQYYEQPYQAPSTGSSAQYPPQPQTAGSQYYEQPYQAPTVPPAGQYPPSSPGTGGGYYEQPYQAPSTPSSAQYPPQTQYGGGTQYQQQYPSTSTAPSGQYPSYSPGTGGGYYEQPYQAPSTPSSAQYPPQTQYGGGTQYQQQYQAPAATPAGQYPSQQQDKSKQQAPVLSLNLNYSVIPKAAKKLIGQKYRGVRFKPESQSADPGTYFAPQPDSELQDAWFVFQLNHVK